MRVKKMIYISLSSLLGIMISYIFHAAIEISYINSTDVTKWYKHLGVGSCALPPYIQYGLLAIGAVGGVMVGFHWWRIVYIEKRHWWFKKRLNGNNN
ncbi:hypothetical protein IID19_00045 [Patescibacteria group bacterium]|nr:hypothetical protein [Patescibacteria group bacterium]